MRKQIKIFIIVISILFVTGIVFCYFFQKIANTNKKERANQKTPISYEQAIEKNDPAECERVTDETQRKQCINLAVITLVREKHDPAYCDKLEPEEIEQCKKLGLYEKMQYEDSLDICQQAASEEEKTDCEEEYYFSMAQEKFDSSLCSNIKHQDIKTECIDTVVFNKEFAANPEKFDCKKLTTEYLKNQCESEKLNTK